MGHAAIVRNFFGEETSLTELKFFFIFCPNNSGTTILSQYFASQTSGYLPPFGNNEGQMAPAVTEMMRTRPWDQDQKFDWAFIRKEWEALAAGDMFVEASPPNLIRVDDIKAVFGQDSSGLISICNPYQHISSAYRRYHKDPKLVARNWLRKARQIMKLRQEYPFFPFVRYEDFVERPSVVNDIFGVRIKDSDLPGKKRSGISGIKSAYCRSIGFFTSEEVISISNILATERDVVGHLGYSLSGSEILDIARERDPEEFLTGQNNRREFDRRLSAKVRVK
ncbi:hypothetical protein [Thioclava indica]|uniref:hypothetical protein n=1 Tax=Thioclava indica TaxID=1353528 RepID=UPI0012DDE36C|nr:hypothetical protein [Thioclava indica]